MERYTKEWADDVLRTIFLERVCKKIACGSQRCDGSPEWVEGCQRYQEFLKTIDTVINGIIKD